MARVAIVTSLKPVGFSEASRQAFLAILNIHQTNLYDILMWQRLG